MLRIIDCFTVDHDYGIVLLAAMLCLLGCASTGVVAGRAVSTNRRVLWISLLSICFAATAWSTHFIAILAYKTSLPISYDFAPTVLSLIAGFALMAAGFTIAMWRTGTLLMRSAGGVLIGSGIIALHYIGIAGLRFPGVLRYDTDLVTVSVIAAVGLGGAAAAVVFDPARRSGSLVGTVLLVLMIVVLHFTGMAAVRLELGLLDKTMTEGISRHSLVVAVSIASASVLLIGTGAALADQQVTKRLARQAERFQTLADGAFEALVVHRNCALVDANVAARTLFGLSADYAGHDISHWGLAARTENTDDDQVIDELELQGANGRLFPAEICRRRIRLGDGSWGELIAIRDQTARKQHEERISYLALHDPLTDLSNRRYFTQLADEAIADARRNDTRIAVFAIDLDNFKLVNDLHGHAGGDKLIRTVARRLSACIGEGEVAARLGGDEFALLQRSVDTADDSDELASKVLASLADPIAIEGAELRVDASIGIALFPDDGSDIVSLMHHADIAMYHAKASGKGTYRLFEPHMNVEIQSRRRFENRLRKALSENALSVAYQPLVDSRNLQPRCFEALLRWNDCELGPVSPAEFIPVAESTGLIIGIGEYVIRQACRDAASWPAPVNVAVNLSVAQFNRNDLISTVKDALEDSGLPGERLELEITESLLIDDRQNALQLLNELKSLGVRIAMDDFGTGYSSLGYLQSFAFDKIKIDRSFVSNLADSPQDASIVQAVAALGRGLHMSVVAEGVETREQLKIIQRYDCDELQGYLIARPMPADQVRAFIDASWDQFQAQLKIA